MALSSPSPSENVQMGVQAPAQGLFSGVGSKVQFGPEVWGFQAYSLEQGFVRGFVRGPAFNAASSLNTSVLS